ncbi:MAG: hypothetical protein M0R05_07580 [Bacilli bacterium]|nr:hypothetical protein [Bacilli bacterium]MDD4077455.1 hypothetical protein [Bacilli bacterium]MDD4389014.1 hypothetical protein [Bacilli bacterium]
MKEKQNQTTRSENVLIGTFIGTAIIIILILICQLIGWIATDTSVAIIMFSLVAINLLCTFTIRKDNRKLSNVFLYNTILLFLLFMVSLLYLLT